MSIVALIFLQKSPELICRHVDPSSEYFLNASLTSAGVSASDMLNFLEKHQHTLFDEVSVIIFIELPFDEAHCAREGGGEFRLAEMRPPTVPAGEVSFGVIGEMIVEDVRLSANSAKSAGPPPTDPVTLTAEEKLNNYSVDILAVMHGSSISIVSMHIINNATRNDLIDDPTTINEDDDGMRKNEDANATLGKKSDSTRSKSKCFVFGTTPREDSRVDTKKTKILNTLRSRNTTIQSARDLHTYVVKEAASANDAVRFEEVTIIMGAEVDIPYDIVGVNRNMAANNIIKRQVRKAIDDKEEKERFKLELKAMHEAAQADPDIDPLDALEGETDFQRVKKWTRKFNIFEKDFVFIPENYNYLKEEWKGRQQEASEDISSRVDNLRFISLERTKDLDTPDLLEQLPALQQLLFRVLGCQPQRAAVHNFVIRLALSMKHIKVLKKG
ncbi:hypothetical protein L2E82_28221 [Cichorium intybus]|uniref:Uncharacterized protein n=1 Tax=Cichorium intybus TaxID=13427 RepID=A0ACB9CV76_CICIN|nr:hypothetical protein L2E82_28221 [Cichorium intybus]